MDVRRLALTIFMLAGLPAAVAHTDEFPQFGTTPGINFKITGIITERKFLVFLYSRCATGKSIKGMPSWCLLPKK